MKFIYKYTIVLLFFFLLTSGLVSAQSFKKGSLNVSISEGSTTAQFRTFNSESKGSKINSETKKGLRDPLILEYGITNKLGIGFSVGNDIFKVDPQFYGLKLNSAKNIQVHTSELCFEFSYHFYTNKKVDMSAFSSFGEYKMELKGFDKNELINENSGGTDILNNFETTGRIARMGTRFKWYFLKRVYFMGMMSAYSGISVPSDSKKLDPAYRFNTNINGIASEIGLGIRIR